VRSVLLALLLTACAEPGFMPTRPHWEVREEPLTVCASAYDGMGAYTDAGIVKMTTDVLSTIDSRLGFKLYQSATDDCDITVTVGAPVEAGWRDPGGDASFDPARTSGLRCAITTANTGSDEILFYVIEHELGHCAGLDHDDWDGSIMRRVQRERADLEFPPWIDDSDRALLRRTYGPQ